MATRYTIYFTNFGYEYAESFPTLEKAIEKAKELCFECSIWETMSSGRQASNDHVASYSPISGVRYF